MRTRCLSCMEEYNNGRDRCPTCGSEPDIDMENPAGLAPGTLLHNRYLLGRALGINYFEIVYIGWDNKQERKVVIREYFPISIAVRVRGQTQISLSDKKKVETFDTGMAHFLREARCLQPFQNNDGIRQIYDSFAENNTAYIITEYLDGEILTDYLSHSGKITADQAIEMFTPVMRSLEAIHKNGMFSFEITPNNILVTREGKAKLIGNMIFYEVSVTPVVTPGYAPPEAYEVLDHHDPRTDVYAMGATMYYAVTGVKPVESIDRKIKDTLPAPDSLVSTIPDYFSNAIMRAMALKRKVRFADMAEFSSILHHKIKVRSVAQKYRWRIYSKVIGITAVLLATITAAIALLSH